MATSTSGIRTQARTRSSLPKHKARQIGPELLVKTSRSGRPLADHDQFGMDFDVEYSLNKNNRWELPDIIASEFPVDQQTTIAAVKVELALSKKEREKIRQSKNHDERYHLRGSAAQSFQANDDGESRKKASKSGRAQLRTWNNPERHSLPHDHVKEDHLASNLTPSQQDVVDYTVVRYTSTNRKADGNSRHGVHARDLKDRYNYAKEVVEYLPKKRKNEMRRLRHDKEIYESY